jgi:4-alpha-glucanotransferase
MNRSSGLLLHVTSLPGPHGIGDLGPAAYNWIDQLAAAKQTWWQILPLGPTGYGDSPYQCFSAFAGNPNLISLERLIESGLLNSADIPPADFPLTEVDYDRVHPFKEHATALAWRKFQATPSHELADPFRAFCRDQAAWLDAYSLYMALKEQHGGVAWLDWPPQHRAADSIALAQAARERAPDIDLHKFRQFLFFHQWQSLRDYAHAHGIRFIGDMPIFVAGDSADVWSRPDLFQLDERRRPRFVAGVPPDYFSATGQLWGNPLYDWQRHKEAGFSWWIDRLRATLRLVDLVRLDHFRGFEAYWAIPADSPTAQTGSWVRGPGPALFKLLEAALGASAVAAASSRGALPLIAEDLGVITPEVDALRRAFNLPGMRILQFAFGGAQEDRFFPHHYDHHTVVYTGTHDNETTVGWFHGLSQRERQFFQRYAPGASADPAWTLIRLAWASVADLAVAPLQDLLRLGNEARMNLPGKAEGNWRWRANPALITSPLVERLADLTDVYQRGPSSNNR